MGILPYRQRENARNEMRRIYVERQLLPWLTSHLQMRNTGLQVFTAVQGALMVAYASSKFWPIIALGLASALAAILWDCRNRDVFMRLHSIAERLLDREVFGIAKDGLANDGLHRQALGTIQESGTKNPRLSIASGFASHTWSIRVVVLTCSVVWCSLLISIVLQRAA
jgi:hypothetical protein